MPIVHLDNKSVSLADIQKCVDLFLQIRSGKEPEKKIVVEAKTKIEAIDPLLFAYFILFKQQMKELQIILALPQNLINRDNEALEYQLKQIGTYAYLMTGNNVFNIYFGKLQVSFDLSASKNFPDPRWFVFTSDFFAILFVSDDLELFKFLFNDSFITTLEKFNLQINKLDDGIVWEKNSESLRNNYHHRLRETSEPKDNRKALLNLARMSFINSLDEAKVAHLFFKDYYDKFSFTAKNKIQAGSLQNEAAFKYYSEIELIFEELQNSSISHQFFFSTILATEMLRDKGTGKDVLNEETKLSFVTKINSLWSFTKDLVAGIKELAKNIREHSQPSIGAISVRLFRTERWIQIKNRLNDETDIYSRYRQFLIENKFTDSDSVIDINVVDIGELGVVPTLIKNSENVLSKVSSGNFEIKKLIEEDVSNLRSNTIKFLNLLDTTTQQLNQQSKRSIAHFGLLTLSKLVEHNHGLIVASSNSGIESRESLCIPKLVSNYSHPINVGTNFNIVLPINQSQSYSTHLPHKISLPFETSAKDIKGVEELFNYQTIGLSVFKKGFEFVESTNYLVQVNFKERDLIKRNDEESLWDDFNSKFSLEDIPANIKYALCFDFAIIKINESQLFRLLGKCELNFPAIPVIAFNISNDCYQKLIRINGEFHLQNQRLDYWNESISTLVYSYQKIRSSRFYFSDVLWGKTRNEFAYLNHFVSLSAPNSTSILNKNKERMKSLISKVGDVNPNTEIFFMNKINLLPFELLLKSSNDTTLFEENTLVLLENELNA